MKIKLSEIKNGYFLVFILAFLNKTLCPQSANLKFDQIGLEQGLSQSTVNAIVQDAYGFMWFGTEDGLNRYDGYSILIFKHNPYDSNSISDNTIWSLLADDKGDLWIGTLNGGINKYVASENKFYHYKHNPSDSTSVSSNFITSMFRDSYKNLWIGTDKGLNLFDIASGKFIKIIGNDFKSSQTTDKSIWAITEDQNKNLWLATSGGVLKLNLYAMNETPGRIEISSVDNRPGNLNSVSGNNVHSIFADNKNVIWAGTWGNGLNSIKKNEDTKNYLINQYRKTANAPNTISSNSIQSIIQDSEGTLWIASYDAGLMSYEPLTDSFIRYSNEAIRTLYQDKSGILWVGTFASGVKLYDKRKNFFNHYYHQKENNNDISVNVITSIYTDNEGKLWVGTYGSGLNSYIQNNISSSPFNSKQFIRDKSYKNNPQLKNSLSSNKLLSICESKDGSIWIGTEEGLNCLNKKTGKYITYKNKPGDDDSPASNLISSMYYDKEEDALWIGYLTGGIDYLFCSSGTFIHFAGSAKDGGEVIRSAVTVIRRDNQNRILAGTLREGVFYFSKKADVFKSGVFKKFGVSNNSISSNVSVNNNTTGKQINNSGVFSIYCEKNGVTWFGTYGGGLNRFDPNTNTFKYYTEQNGLPNNVVYGILPDRSGNLWLSTNKGISCFNILKESFRNYDVKDGLQANEFNQGAYFASGNGELFFGGVNGFNSFLPEKISDNNYIPPVYITAFKIFDNPLPNPGSLSATKKIELSYSQNFFTFEFVALNYTTAEKNQYAYMLEGFDQDWHKVTALQRYGSYTNLDPGEYILRVKGSNNDGIWNEEGIAISIIVNPPFWMTWWFRGIGIILFVSAILLFYQRRFKSLKQEKELQQKISHRLIEKQEEERRRIALEMHDSLGHSLLFIKNRANLTEKKNFDIESAGENLKQISSAASEALKTVREISHNLRPPELDQLGLSETLRSILLNFRESSSIKINGSVENIDGLIQRDMEINIVRILQEALSNIVKHSEANECEVLVSESSESIILSISDNGKGFELNNKHSVWNEDIQKRQTAGLGLAGMSERVRILGGSHKIESAQGKGTKIEIKIPLTITANKTDKPEVTNG